MTLDHTQLYKSLMAKLSIHPDVSRVEIDNLLHGDFRVYVHWRQPNSAYMWWVGPNEADFWRCFRIHVKHKRNWLAISAYLNGVPSNHHVGSPDEAAVYGRIAAERRALVHRARPGS